MADVSPTASALELAAALRSREISAVELLDACLAAVDALNPALNAVTWRNDEQARATAAEADRRIAAGDESPFLGVPIPIKDLTPVSGWPVTYGSHGAPEEPSETGELVVDALERAGFVLCGRTNTPAFGVITAAENTRHGISRNPWDTNRSPGSSGGGAASAVAAGMFPIAHANDGGGVDPDSGVLLRARRSEAEPRRRPRLARAGSARSSRGVGRRFRQHGATLDKMSSPDPRGPGPAPPRGRRPLQETAATPPALRIGLMAQAPLGMPTDEECTAAARSAAAALEGLGHSVQEVEVPTISEEMIPAFIALTQAGLGDYEGVDWSLVEPHIAHQRKAAGELSGI